MKNPINKIVLIFLNVILLSGCAGTIHTVSQTPEYIPEYKKAYIISAENSQFIKFKFGVILPYTYIPLPDDPAEDHEIIGNTDVVIKMELEKYGISAEIGEKGNVPEDIDIIVMYNDIWRWDFKKILDRLDIVFISPNDNKEIAKSTYKIYKNKEMHNFPTPEKEVPKMI
ncbi:MAG: hypothetical protein OEW75_11370 [Cyclobacteriaceae bacterium]|nr:hypothetical protein [Cyclobacteriaceae bacterium]